MSVKNPSEANKTNILGYKIRSECFLWEACIGQQMQKTVGFSWKRKGKEEITSKFY